MKQKLSQQVKAFFIGEKERPLKFEFKGIIKFIPLIICGGFFALTVILFAIGPFDWNISNPISLYTFLFFCIVSLVGGYLLGIYKGKVSKHKVGFNTNRILISSTIVFFITYFPLLYATTGKVYPDIITGIVNAGEAYRNAKYFSEHGLSLWVYVRIIFSPLTIISTPITLFFMPKLSRIGKLLGISVIIANIAMGLSQGINKYSADFVMQIILFLSLLFFTHPDIKEQSRKNNVLFYRLKIIGGALIVCFTFFVNYSMNMQSRVAMDEQIALQNQNISEVVDRSSSQMPEDDTDNLIENELSEETVQSSIEEYSTFGVAKEKENTIFNILPPKIKGTALYLISYITHGYKGLSFAMEHEFTPAYGLGFSEFFRHNILKVIGQANKEEMIYEKTYAAKTSRNGWETGKVWSSFFVFPASDISFLGTIALVFFIGYFFSLSWKDAILTENCFAIVVFFNICFMIFYFPANNQLFQGGELAVGFSVTFIMWLVTRKVMKKKGSDSSK